MARTPPVRLSIETEGGESRRRLTVTPPTTENLINKMLCPCGGIGRRVGLKIQSGFTLGASSSLAKGILKRLTEMWVFFLYSFRSCFVLFSLVLCTLEPDGSCGFRTINIVLQSYVADVKLQTSKAFEFSKTFQSCTPSSRYFKSGQGHFIKDSQ